MTLKNSTIQQIDQDNNSTLNLSKNMDPSGGITFAPVTMIIPAIVVGFLVFVFVVYYLWQCWDNYAAEKEAEKEAAKELAREERAKAKLEETVVPIAEPEDFSTLAPRSPANDDTDVEDAS